MRRLDRYIGKSVLSSVLIVSMIVLGLDMLFAYIGELEDLAGGYDAIQALVYVVLTAPRRLYDLLPVAPVLAPVLPVKTIVCHICVPSALPHVC